MSHARLLRDPQVAAGGLRGVPEVRPEGAVEEVEPRPRAEGMGMAVEVGDMARPVQLS